tara:strand:+ start:391 stop:696 length:306 start_codon:yes stop_codon:yes gene_type:complete
MYLAMNRFRVKRGQESRFEQIWRDRETFLDSVPGFQSFNLLRGPEAEDHCLYASHTVWLDKAAFIAWTGSEQFRKAHANARSTPKEIYLGAPQLEGFESIL